MFYNKLKNYKFYHSKCFKFFTIKSKMFFDLSFALMFYRGYANECEVKSVIILNKILLYIHEIPGFLLFRKNYIFKCEFSSEFAKYL